MRHNLSAMFRTAESFGIQMYILCVRKIYSSSASRGSERWLQVEIVNSIGQLVQEIEERRIFLFHSRFSRKFF